MTLPSYQVNLISCSFGSTLRVFSPLDFYSLRYSRVLNDVGIVVLVFPSNDAIIELFDLDNFIEVYRTSPITGDLIKEETYLTRLTHRFREGDEERFVVGGLSLNHLLMRRIIDPDDDPTATDGYSRKDGPADDVMYGYVIEQAGSSASTDRQFPNFTTVLGDGSSVEVDKNFRYDNLFKALVEIAYESSMDFLITRTIGNNLEFRAARIGTDKSRTTNYPDLPSVELNPLFGNLSEPSLETDRRKEQNYVYTLGQGQAEARLVVQAFTDDVALSPYNRCEYVKDARNIDKLDTTALENAAVASLNEKRVETTFDFVPTGVDAGSIYRLDWDIGDLVTAHWNDFSTDLRIQGIEIEISDENERIDVTIGEKFSENF